MQWGGESYDFHMTSLGRLVQRGPAVVEPGSCVSTVLDEEPCEQYMTLAGCVMQRSPTGLILGCRIGAVLAKEPCDFDITPWGCVIAGSARIRPGLSRWRHTRPGVVRVPHDHIQLGCLMQWGPPEVRPGCYVGTVFDKEPSEQNIVMVGCPMQQSPSVLVLDCRVGAVLD